MSNVRVIVEYSAVQYVEMRTETQPLLPPSYCEILGVLSLSPVEENPTAFPQID